MALLYGVAGDVAAQSPGRTFADCAECPQMVVIPAGSFTMGSSGKSPAGLKFASDEQPQHQVKLRSFALGKFEVTQAQWTALMGDNPSVFKGAGLPVDSVSWDDTQKFLQRLNARTGKRYRLPSEAEWEYAARAGSGTAFWFGDDPAMLDGYAWFEGNADGKPHPVGQKLPNKFGLHDMNGNVWEWVQDCYKDSYMGAPADGRPVGGKAGCDHVDRGGAWLSSPNNQRSANRDWGAPHYRLNNLGFRVARDLP
jgi:formylglycine-generating enzyme required for sulfatase activity